MNLVWTAQPARSRSSFSFRGANGISPPTPCDHPFVAPTRTIFSTLAIPHHVSNHFFGNTIHNILRGKFILFIHTTTDQLHRLALTIFWTRWSRCTVRPASELGSWRRRVVPLHRSRPAIIFLPHDNKQLWWCRERQHTFPKRKKTPQQSKINVIIRASEHFIVNKIVRIDLAWE